MSRKKVKIPQTIDCGRCGISVMIGPNYKEMLTHLIDAIGDEKRVFKIVRCWDCKQLDEAERKAREPSDETMALVAKVRDFGKTDRVEAGRLIDAYVEKAIAAYKERQNT